MSIDDRISALERRHHKLDEKILELQKNALSDSALISSLKKEKLEIKDELFRIKS